MAITPKSAPEAIVSAAMREAAAARSGGIPLADLDFGGGKAKLTASPPIPVYTLPIPVLAGTGTATLADAVQHGWRVLTQDSEGGQIVDLSASSGKPVAVRRGRSLDLLASASQVAQDAARPDTGYEPRIIDFGRLGLSALWLHAAQGADILFRLDGAPASITEAQLLEEAGSAARRYLGKKAPDAESPHVPGDIGG